jgi:hypothetical protein
MFFVNQIFVKSLVKNLCRESWLSFNKVFRREKFSVLVALALESLKIFQKLDGKMYPSRYVLISKILTGLPPIKSTDSTSSPLVAIFTNSILSNVSRLCSRKTSENFKILLTLVCLKQKNMIDDLDSLYSILTSELSKEQKEFSEANSTNEIREHFQDPNFSPLLPFWKQKEPMQNQSNYRNY